MPVWGKYEATEAHKKENKGGENKMALNDMQERFCNEYLVDLNATQAAKRAGYKDSSAYSQGQRLLKHDEVQAKIQELKAKRQERVEITQDMVLRELAIIAFSNAADYAAVIEKRAIIDGVPMENPDGSPMMYRTVEPVLTAELTEDQKKALAVIKRGRDGFEVRPYDKTRALELLGKHLGMFTDKMELNAELSPVVIKNDVRE